MSWVDFWFWVVVMEEVRKSRPSTLAELKAVGEAFVESVDPEEVKRPARSTWNHATHRPQRVNSGKNISVFNDCGGI